MEEINIYNLLITFLTTIVGTVFGGIVTLMVNKKFEIARLRLNNIDEMSKNAKIFLSKENEVVVSSLIEFT